MTKKRLGRGLDALIPLSEEEPSQASHGPQGIQQVNTADITPNPPQPRSSIVEDELQELAQSIKEHGVIQP